MRLLRALRFLTCVLLVPAATAPRVHGADGVRSDFVAQAEAIRSAAARLDQAWFAAVSRLQAETTCGAAVLRIRLVGAVYGKDLHVEAYRVGEYWARAVAWAPEWNSAIHRADVSGLKSAGDRIEGELRVHLAYDGVLPIEGVSVACPLDVEIASAGTVVKGTFMTATPSEQAAQTHAAPPSKGAVTGTLTPWLAAAAPPRDLPVMKTALIDLYTLYGMAVGWEADAGRFYQMVRAAELARTCRITYREAVNNALIYASERPAFDPPSVAREKKQSRARTLSLDEVDAGAALEGSDGAAATGRPSGDGDPGSRGALEILKRMRSSVQALCALVDASGAAPAGAPVSVTKGSLVTDDPDFGPWYGEESLAFDEATGRHALPPGAGGGQGTQRWPCIGTWKLLGPFRLTRWDLDSPLLPEWPVDPAAACRVDVEGLKFGGSYKGPDVARWVPARAERPFGYILPPNWSSANRVSRGCSRALTDRHSGIEHSTVFAVTELVSERDVELWAAVGVAQQGKLWLDDRLCWVGPERVDEAASQSVNLIRLRLHAGSNRLLLRCDVGYASPSFWVRICTRGQPRAAADVRAHQQAVAASRAAVAPPPPGGFRGNGTGFFPDADVPGAWHYKKKINVLWQAPLPYWSNASPALAADRLFVAVEPHTLVCLAKADGRVLWERPVTVLDLIENEADRREGWRLYEVWRQARRERDAIPAHALRPDKWIEKEAFWFEGKGLFEPRRDAGEGAASPQMAALLARRDELEKAPDPTAVQEDLNKVLGQIDALRMKEAEGDPNSPMKKVKRLDEAWGAFIRFLSQRSFVQGMSGYWQDYDGYAFATPVTDGTNVWWKNGMEAVACFDLDGRRKWLVNSHGGASQSAAASSPVLADGKLIVKTPYYVAQEANRWESSWRSNAHGIRYAAYDAATGITLWETPGLPTYGWNWNANTPAVVELTNGSERMKVLVTAGGSVVRIEDGKVLVRNIGADSTDASVLPVGDVVIFSRPHLVAFRLVMADRDTVGFVRLWSHQLGSHGIGYQGCFADPEHEVLYHETGFGHYYYRWPCQHRGGPNEDPCWAIVKDLRTGDVLATPKVLRNSGHMGWSLSSVTRDYAFMVGGDHIFRGAWIPPAWAVTLSRGREPIVLARNIIDRTYGGGAYEKGRIYFRGYQGVTCIGYTGDEGRRYQARVFAESVMDEIHATPPRRADEPRTPAPIAGPLPDKTVPAELIPKLEPHSWLIAGPLPAASDAGARESLGAGRRLVRPGDTVAGGGASCAFAALDNATLKVPGVHAWEYYPDFTFVEKQRRWVDLGKALRGEAPGVCYLYACLSNAGDRILRFEQTTSGVRAWLGGVEVTDGDRVRLGKGVYGLLLEVRAGKVPEDGLLIGPRFFESDDPAAEWAAWQRFARAHRKYLDDVLRLAPDSVEARRAKAVVDAL